MGLIYLTTNIVNNKKYIGKQQDSLKKNYLGSGTAIKKAIKKYGRDNFEKVIIIDSIYCPDMLAYLEEYYINLYDAVNSEEYYNIAKGGFGGGNLGKKMSDEAKSNMSKASKIRGASFEYKQKISKLHLGRRYSEEHKAKLKVAHKNQTNLNLAKPVAQYTLAGEFIKEFPSISEACRQLGHDPNKGGLISRTCRLKQKHAFGYFWTYKDI